MTSTPRPGTVELTEFASTKKVGDGIWTVQEHGTGDQLQNIVVKRPHGLVRLFSRTFQEVYPLDTKEWSKDGMAYRTRQANSGLPGGSAGAYGVCHAEIGEILPRPSGHVFDLALHEMPKDIIRLSPTLFLLDGARLLEVRGDHVHFMRLPFYLNRMSGIDVNQEQKQVLVSASGTTGHRCVLFDYQDGKNLLETTWR